jgi:Rap1a immunity proteins
MRDIRKLLAIIVLGLFTCAMPANADPGTFNRSLEAINKLSMEVSSLRAMYCGGEFTDGDQNAKNEKFVGCVMYVLGVVDMLREWQKLDPTNALPLCVPRNVTSGQLIIVVQDYIEGKQPWRQAQHDATTAIIGALKAKWPCPSVRP